MLSYSASGSQRGYIGLTIVAFLIILSMILYPWAPPEKEEEGCFVGKAPDGNEEYMNLSQLPAVSGMDEDPASGSLGGGPDPDLKADYILIRKNVPADSYAMTHIQPVANPLFTTLAPRPGYDLAYPTPDGGKRVESPDPLDLRLRHEGLIFFINKDPSSVRQVSLPNRRTNGINGPQGTIINDMVHDVDVYQDVRKFNQADKGYKIEDLFKCGSEAAIDLYNVTVPVQQISATKDQLQLEWILFQRQGVWGVHCKPAVYLYPEKKQLVNVKVFPKGELSYTDPPYDASKGWSVWAEPTGDLYRVSSIENRAEKYSYLYYESKLLDSEIRKPQVGWVVKGSTSTTGRGLKELFDEVLPELGLNGKEQKDFEDYWLTKLPESPYYFVGLIEKDQRDYLERLVVTPNPETAIRFSLYFEMLDQPINVLEPKIQTPSRRGFTLVDWGGMIKLHKGTPFTCSQ